MRSSGTTVEEVLTGPRPWWPPQTMNRNNETGRWKTIGPTR